MSCSFTGWNFWAVLVVSVLLVWEWYLGRYGKTVNSILDLLAVYSMVLIVSIIILGTLLFKRKSNDGNSDSSPRNPEHR